MTDPGIPVREGDEIPESDSAATVSKPVTRRPGRPAHNANAPKRPVKKAVKKRTPRPRKSVVSPQTKKGYKYDWPEVRNAYVEGILPDGDDPTSESRVFPTMKDLSERMGVPFSRMRERAADERWTDQRQDFMLRLSKARQARRIQEMGKDSIAFDQSTLKAAQIGIGVITTRMAEIAKEVQAAQVRRQQAERLVEAGYDVDPNDLRTVIDAKELDTLARAAVQWQMVGQKALGTDITRMEIQHDISASLEVDVTTTTIAAELGRDDPDRLAAFLQAAKRSGLLEVVMQEADEADMEERLAITDGDDGIVDAEVVEEIA